MKKTRFRRELERISIALTIRSLDRSYTPNWVGSISVENSCQI